MGDSFTLIQNGETKQIGKNEFENILRDWKSKNAAFCANTHLDIENIETVFGVKIDVKKDGEWLVKDVAVQHDSL